ncbi:hypothetical protein NGTWS0302_32230 [Mycolicibacterium cyprinidarum]|uniref:Uncharacterized protein n=1 Tax=Mycolicibacterium cyprinidarum TaxID=2860311 RepID=A0ABQ4V495_9MYCO|nr:hypothetical protein NGTWS1702_32800 [Mycolicibacterium sp. NGTWSNA01]GJF12599.1 hypothetical protein NGTWS1803_22720 [Mycolicibacterium sp. NGTWS1803]GJF12813.1 hypothetical protein NGTWS0302_32230 [Mycolicibacterium sp. NGTWS0302]
MTSFPYAGRTIIVLGDHGTGQRVELLVGKAAEHGATIAEFHTFEPGEARSHDDLGHVGAVVDALSRALALRVAIWAPFPHEDLGREEHIRRLSLVLQRHGLNLLLGPNLWPCPLSGGINEIDNALRQEVRAVEDLDHAVLAAAGLRTLSDEIEQALHPSGGRSAPPATQHHDEQPCDLLELIKADFGPYPELPAITAQWPQRRAALKRFAGWLVYECGLTQAEAADLLNTTGHRTAQGRLWQRSSVSALVNGRYDRRSAA